MDDKDLIVDTGEDLSLTVESSSINMSVSPIPNINLDISEPMTDTLTIDKTDPLTMNLDMAVIVGGGVPYTGEYTVTPKAHEQTVLQTKRKLMLNDVTVLEVPYFETSNISGTTVYIAEEIDIHGN